MKFMGLLAGLFMCNQLTSGEIKIQFIEKQVNEIPVLMSYCDDGRVKPLIIVCHGFSGQKEDFAPYIKELASMGYFAVTLDNRLHGKRNGKKFDEIAIKEGKLDTYVVRKAIKETADDIVSLLDTLLQNPQIDSSQIGITGVSMGGFITYRVTMIDKRIKAAAPIISSPFWDDIPGDTPAIMSDELKKDLRDFAECYNPGNHPDAFYPRPMLMQIGEIDRHMNTERVQHFSKTLKEIYQSDSSDVRLIVYPKTAHTFTNSMWKETVLWFNHYLNARESKMNTNTKRVTRSYKMKLSATPEKIFPLLCPTREYEWIPHWKAELLFSESGFAEDHCIFKTTFPNQGGDEIWVVSHYLPNQEIQFYRFNSARLIRYTITLSPVSIDETEAKWSQIITALNEKGINFIDFMSEDRYNEQMANIEMLLNGYLKTGKMIEHDEI